MPARAALGAALALGVAGCSATVALAPESPEAAAANTTATVEGYDVPAIEGRILEGDRRSIVVERCNDGRTVPVARENIRDIDHPGDVLALGGVMVVVVGAALLPLSFYSEGSCANAYTSGSGCNEPERHSGWAVPSIALLSVGVGATVTGLVIWKVSVAAARDAAHRYSW